MVESSLSQEKLPIMLFDNNAKEELMEVIDNMSRKQHMQEDFLLNITHDLRAHLNVILSGLQYMECNGENQSEKNSEYVSMLRRNSLKMLKLINNLIDTTKLENSYNNISRKNVDIVSTVEGTISCIDKYAKEKNINLIFDTNEEECITAIDVDAIDRVIMNLLSNAIKFSYNDSSIYIYMDIKESEVIIKVKDEGIGISKEDQKNIFNRFYQVNKGKIIEQAGSGIGLDLVHYLINAHNGKIRLISDEGKGSEFVITLPIEIMTEEGFCRTDNRDKIDSMLELEFSDIYLT